jgi:hypothetical protein
VELEHFFFFNHDAKLVLPLVMQDPTVTVKAIFTSTGFEQSTADEDVGIVLDATSFYAEQGGQVNTRHSRDSSMLRNHLSCT